MGSFPSPTNKSPLISHFLTPFNESPSRLGAGGAVQAVLQKVTAAINADPAGARGAYKRMSDRGDLSISSFHQELARLKCDVTYVLCFVALPSL